MNKALLSVVWLETSGGNFGLTKSKKKRNSSVDLMLKEESML